MSTPPSAPSTHGRQRPRVPSALELIPPPSPAWINTHKTRCSLSAADTTRFCRAQDQPWAPGAGVGPRGPPGPRVWLQAALAPGTLWLPRVLQPITHKPGTYRGTHVALPGTRTPHLPTPASFPCPVPASARRRGGGGRREEEARRRQRRTRHLLSLAYKSWKNRSSVNKKVQVQSWFLLATLQRKSARAAAAAARGRGGGAQARPPTQDMVTHKYSTRDIDIIIIINTKQPKPPPPQNNLKKGGGIDAPAPGGTRRTAARRTRVAHAWSREHGAARGCTQAGVGEAGGG